MYEVVTVRGVRYRVIGRKNLSSLGSKFFGKYSFTLCDEAGNRFTAYGKRVAHNSKLTVV
jgi:hypothetical protein